jgi:ATP-dependent Lon protease
MASTSVTLDSFPTVPLRDMVIFPQAVQPLFVGTESSISALDAAMGSDKKSAISSKA